MKSKKAVITILLVDDSKEMPNEEVEREIFESLSKDYPKIPWLAKVEKVTVVEN